MNFCHTFAGSIISCPRSFGKSQMATEFSAKRRVSFPFAVCLAAAGSLCARSSRLRRSSSKKHVQAAKRLYAALSASQENRAAAVSQLRRFSPCHRLYCEQFYHARRVGSQNFSLRRSMRPPKKQAPLLGAPPKKVPGRSPELFEFLGFGMKSQQGI